MTKLNSAQEALLDQIEATKAEEHVVVEALETQLRVLKEGAAYPRTVALMREAFESGVPKSRIGAAFGTKNQYAVNRLLGEQTAAMSNYLPPTLAPVTYATSHNSTSSHTATATSPAFSPQEDSVEVTLLQPTDEGYPEFLRDVENPPRAAKIQVSLQNPTPYGKIGGLVAVVDLDHKIAYTTEPTPLTNLFESDRATWPEPLETALAPYLDLDLAR